MLALALAQIRSVSYQGCSPTHSNINLTQRIRAPKTLAAINPNGMIPHDQLT